MDDLTTALLLSGGLGGKRGKGKRGRGKLDSFSSNPLLLMSLLGGGGSGNMAKSALVESLLNSTDVGGLSNMLAQVGMLKGGSSSINNKRDCDNLGGNWDGERCNDVKGIYDDVFETDGKLKFKDFLKFAACHKKGKYYSSGLKRCVSKQDYKVDKIYRDMGQDAVGDYDWWSTTPEAGGLTSKAAIKAYNKRVASRIRSHYFPNANFNKDLPGYAQRLDTKPLKYIAKVRAILNTCETAQVPLKNPQTDKYHSLQYLADQCNNISINERAYYKDRSANRADFVKQDKPNVSIWPKFFTQGQDGSSAPVDLAEDFGTSMFGKRRRYRRKSKKSKKSKKSRKGKKGHKKPPASLVKRARKYGVKISKKVGKKRVYKSVSVIKRQIKKKMTKLRRAARRKH
jgi:hypothetical protein